MTLLDPLGRVELSGATVGNWVAKTANLLHAQGSPARVGLLLPLHWQAVTLLLGAATAGATVVVAREPGELADCEVAFVAPDRADAALDAGAGDVLAVSPLPLGGRLHDLPPMVLDAGAELPAYGDRLERPAAPAWSVTCGGEPVDALPDLGLGPADRVLTCLPPWDPQGLRAGLLAPLAAGSALVLLPSGRPGPGLDAEGVTATVGLDLEGVRRLA